jgi:hypothetical protein
LFYGDGIITPAVSVLSAVEGLKGAPGIGSRLDQGTVQAISAGILIALFLVQSRGTAQVAKFFGPITAIWFLTLAGLGLFHIREDLSIFRALSPHFGVLFLITRSRYIAGVSMPRNLAAIGDAVFRLPATRQNAPALEAFVIIALLIGVSALILERRVRGVEVVA